MVAVIIDKVSVDFPIYGPHRALRRELFERTIGGLVQRDRRDHDRVVVRALIDASLEISEGDRLALIGQNGAGKSTLLKVIAGVYEPVAGKVMVEGRITPLLEAVPGFDAEDTGYDNIITAGLLRGMTREEIESRIPEIEEFSELGNYLSLPARTYSTGMKTRLGFAIATAAEPEILLLDEGIGTGDARFTERATGRMKNFIGRSRILVLASHSEQLIRSACNKAVLMQSGRLLDVGPIEKVLDAYQSTVRKAASL
jgi:ABC-type polysaccharide/polyol phosphate transport system ATPase subunit